MTFSIHDHLLYKNRKQVPFYDTPNKSGWIDPKYLVIHYTATGGSAENVGKYFQNPDANVSAHLTVGTDGTVIQSVAFNTKAWHAGRSRWDGYVGLNSHSIGIEVVNPGPLTKVSDGKYKSWFGRTYTTAQYDIVDARHRNGGREQGWIPFTEEQNNFLLEVGAMLMKAYNLREAVGHDMISPNRKTDPGPCMDDRIYHKLNGERSQDGDLWDYEVTSRALNLRSGPGTSNPRVALLRRGDKVDRTAVVGNWFEVETEHGHYGYVHSNYVRKI